MKTGDTVRLKSGGPVMTVEAVDDYNLAHCTWFDKVKLERGKFAVDALEQVDMSEEGKIKLDVL